MAHVYFQTISTYTIHWVHVLWARLQRGKQPRVVHLNLNDNVE